MNNEHTSSGLARRVSQALSLLLHPVFVPLLVVGLLKVFCTDVFAGIPPATQKWWLYIIGYTTILFPLLVVFLLWRLKFIESMQMHGLKERYGPLIASMLFYFWIFWLFHKQFAAPEWVQIFLFSVFINTVAVFMASIFFKISMHASAWGAVLGYAVLLLLRGIPGSLFFFLLVLLLAALAGTARLVLQAHTHRELYSGYICGLLMQWLSACIIHYSFF
ncbi:MAG TPA: hypothetical protein PLP34_07425 [Chitinophagaceae bacterium]|nr:hypothetical protein [Chitinophagaceae bacterium]HNF72225.1 hypothetical protein [Chitinophagaceae bacterium]